MFYGVSVMGTVNLRPHIAGLVRLWASVIAKMFGAMFSMKVEFMLTHAAHIAMNSFIESKQ